MSWTRIRKQLIDGVINRDFEQIARIADWMRFEAGLNYDQSFAVANHLSGVSESDWENLLYEADQVAGV